MAETRLTAYCAASGLLSRLGYASRVEPGYVPPPAHHRRHPVPAIITDAPPIVVGYAVTITASEPEAHLPEQSARAGRVPHGESGGPPWAFWLDNK